MTSVGTSAQFLFGTGNQRASFIIHADADNTDTVNISGTDPKVVQDFEELLPGQSISFVNYQGSVWAIAEGSAQNVYIPFVSYAPQVVEKST